MKAYTLSKKPEENIVSAFTTWYSAEEYLSNEVAITDSLSWFLYQFLFL